MTKVGRNDPCTCGSGKKFKKCCENNQKTKKFQAQVLTSSQASKVSSLFKRAAAPQDPPNVLM